MHLSGSLLGCRKSRGPGKAYLPLNKVALSELFPPPACFLTNGITKGVGGAYQSAHQVSSPPPAASLMKSLPAPPFFLKVFINDLGVSVGVTYSAVFNSSKEMLPPKIIAKIY
jgi:hypothetical protein